MQHNYQFIGMCYMPKSTRTVHQKNNARSFVINRIDRRKEGWCESSHSLYQLFTELSNESRSFALIAKLLSSRLFLALELRVSCGGFNSQDFCNTLSMHLLTMVLDNRRFDPLRRLDFDNWHWPSSVFIFVCFYLERLLP
uniref:Uncharacterized protein n=1 Tax=Romanomermis culicivorax TaxID=13658 RepID=A0A915IKE6_ROMCU